MPAARTRCEARREKSKGNHWSWTGHAAPCFSPEKNQGEIGPAKGATREERVETLTSDELAEKELDVDLGDVDLRGNGDLVSRASDLDGGGDDTGVVAADAHVLVDVLLLYPREQQSREEEEDGIRKSINQIIK